MVRKFFWVLTILAAACAASGLVDRRHAKQRRELWAEATDPV
ncbi:hypothetical protein [Tessaracoccus rhinocerotis]|nr:hypothetical protein [Tessaracoccus rhinocerotis]